MKFGVVFKEDNEAAKELVEKVSEYLKDKGQEVIGQLGFSEADFILTFGGDGTLIHQACEFAELQVPLVGINVGRLGFLTAAEGRDWQKVISLLLENKVFISERMTLDASIENLQTPFRAVNEVVVKGFYRVIDLSIGINGQQFLKIAGDGVIVSTQTGSTAYSLSSGGPIVDPDLDCFLVTPINPTGLPIPSAVLSPSDVVRIKVIQGNDVSLIIDGQEHTKLKESDVIKIAHGKYRVKFGYLDKNHFVRALGSKFGLRGRGLS